MVRLSGAGEKAVDVSELRKDVLGSRQELSGLREKNWLIST